MIDFDNMTKNIISFLLKKGIELTLKLDSEDQIYFDLNTKAKSHLYLFPSKNSLILKGRYDHQTTIDYSDYDDFDDIFNQVCFAVIDCLYGRDYMNTDWVNLLVERNLLTRKVQTTETITIS